MQLSVEQVEQIAQLARLELSAEEKVRYAEQLSAVFGYVEQLNEVDTTGIVETCQVTGIEDVVRADVVEASSLEKQQKLIALFPEKLGNLLKVKKVFDEKK